MSEQDNFQISQEEYLKALEAQREEASVIPEGALDSSIANGALMSGTCCGSRTSNDCHS